MIYIKIYLDKDENGEDMLVFDSAKKDNEKNFFTVAGEKKKRRILTGEYYTQLVCETKVHGVEQVAISPEAKALFLEMLSDESVCQRKQFFPDFEFGGCGQGQYCWNSGMFSFAPPDIKSGDTSRRLRRGEVFTVEYSGARNALEYMTPCDNEMLKGLDLSEPVDETLLLDRYYEEMRARGEELSCDVDTIRKTPLRYLTEAQKEVIRADYRRMVNSYDAQEWNEHRDYDHGALLMDKIEGELIRKYGKIVK